MGGQQSQPQPGVKILGVQGGAGGFGKIMENLSAKVSFDPNTGAVSVETRSGNTQSSATYVPNDQLQDLAQYIKFVAQNTKAGTDQNPGVYPVMANMMAFDAIGTQVGVESVGTVIPSVTAWQIKNPPVRAVVYTDKAGNSKFLYKNDPGNVVQLVPNGSKIAAGASQQGVAVKQADGPGMNECEKFRKLMTMCSSTVSAAPAAGTSTYAIQGDMYPIQVTGGGYPMWLIILIIAILIGTLFFVKNS